MIGKNHGNADALSRMDYCHQCKTDHQMHVMFLAKTKQMASDDVEIVKNVWLTISLLQNPPQKKFSKCGNKKSANCGIE